MYLLKTILSCGLIHLWCCQSSRIDLKDPTVIQFIVRKSTTQWLIVALAKQTLVVGGIKSSLVRFMQLTVRKKSPELSCEIGWHTDTLRNILEAKPFRAQDRS